VPLWRSPGEEFDDLVLDAVEDLEQQWSTDLESVEFAVEDVPSVVGGEFDPEVVADHGVPLGRLYRDGLDGVRTPVIVVYRRPVEARAHEGVDRSDLVFAVVTELVAELLGRDPDEFG
jgi:predicted Zn-dependent protease with MMP-like domain